MDRGRGTEWRSNHFVKINEKPKYDSYIVLIMMETKLPCDTILKVINQLAMLCRAEVLNYNTKSVDGVYA